MKHKFPCEINLVTGDMQKIEDFHFNRWRICLPRLYMCKKVQSNALYNLNRDKYLRSEGKHICIFPTE